MFGAVSLIYSGLIKYNERKHGFNIKLQWWLYEYIYKPSLLQARNFYTVENENLSIEKILFLI